MSGVIRHSLRLGAWPWVRAGLQAATLLLLAFALAPLDYGRYVVAFAVASCIAPLLVGGPAYVYVESHPAFGCPADQFARVWVRALVVFGPVCALAVPLCMGVFANDWAGWWVWLLVGITEIVFAALIEMTSRHYQLTGRHTARRVWRALPYGLRLCALFVILAFQMELALAEWVALVFAMSSIAGVIGMLRVPRRDAPRSLEALVRLVRVGFRYDNGAVANRIIADGDKPFVARFIDPIAAGALFIAQRVVDLVSLPLQAVVADSLPRLLEAPAEERKRLWRSAAWVPGLYAVFAGVVLFAAARLVHAWFPGHVLADTGLERLCWLPLLAFARGMLGNSAVVAGRGDAYVRSVWCGAIVRMVGAVCLIAWFGWMGAIVSLLLAELACIAYLLLAARCRSRLFDRRVSGTAAHPSVPDRG
jgi:O-antigen/teichoic acid export membrane protein